MATQEDPPVSLATVGRHAAILTAGTAVVQVIGIVRELFLAAEVGISSELDALIIGLVLPVTLSGVLTSGIVTALLPAYADAKEAGGESWASRLVGTVLVWVALAGLGLSVLMWLLAGPLVAVTGPGLSAEGVDQEAVDYLRQLAPLAFLGGVTGIFYALCQAESRFAALAVSTVAGPAITLLIMLSTWNTLGLDGLVVGTLVGAVITTSVLLVATVRARIAPRPRLVARGLGLGALARHAAPLTVSSMVSQLEIIADRAIASLIVPGGVSALRFGEVLMRFPIGAIGPAWGTAVYPALVQASRSRGGSGLADATTRTLRFSLAVFVPIAALSMAVAPLAVAVVYGRGAFSGSDVALTSHVVSAFAPLMVLLIVAPVITGALNARRQGMVLLAAGVMTVSINLVLDVAFGLTLGIAGVALATSVTTLLVTAWKGRRLQRLEPGFRLAPLARATGQAVTATLPAAVPFGILIWTGHYPADFLARVVLLGIVGSVGLASYVPVAARLGFSEPRTVAMFAWGAVARRRRLRRSPG